MEYACLAFLRLLAGIFGKLAMNAGERSTLARELEQEAAEGQTLGPKLMQQTSDGVRLIRERLKIVQSRRKSCGYKERRELGFAVGDFVFISVLPWKGVIC